MFTLLLDNRQHLKDLPITLPQRGGFSSRVCHRWSHAASMSSVRDRGTHSVQGISRRTTIESFAGRFTRSQDQSVRSGMSPSLLRAVHCVLSVTFVMESRSIVVRGILLSTMEDTLYALNGLYCMFSIADKMMTLSPWNNSQSLWTSGLLASRVLVMYGIVQQSEDAHARLVSLKPTRLLRTDLQPIRGRLYSSPTPPTAPTPRSCEMRCFFASCGPNILHTV